MTNTLMNTTCLVTPGAAALMRSAPSDEALDAAFAAMVDTGAADGFPNRYYEAIINSQILWIHRQADDSMVLLLPNEY